MENYDCFIYIYLVVFVCRIFTKNKNLKLKSNWFEGQPRFCCISDLVVHNFLKYSFLIAGLCLVQEIKSYPTFMFFQNGKFIEQYKGGRTKEDFISYVSKPPKAKEEL